MCHISGIIFGASNIKSEEVKGKTVLEVGSYDINGSLRPIIESFNPKKYIGVDIIAGPKVDIVCDAKNIVDNFGENLFDLVIATEVLEHVADWKKVVSNIKRVTKPGGIILITTRSYGFEYHGYPEDFWRYELEDMKAIFLDCKIEALESDRLYPGVFVKVIKPKDFLENDLKDYSLYSIVTNRRIVNLDNNYIKSFYFKRKKFKSELMRNGLESLRKIKHVLRFI